MPKRPAIAVARLAAVIAAGPKSTQSKTTDRPHGSRARIMYIERKAGALTGEARIGRVTFNRTGRTIFYREHLFHRIVGGGFKSNYYDEATGEDYWISGCKRRGGDRLYATNIPCDSDSGEEAE